MKSEWLALFLLLDFYDVPVVISNPSFSNSEITVVDSRSPKSVMSLTSPRVISPRIKTSNNSVDISGLSFDNSPLEVKIAVDLTMFTYNVIRSLICPNLNSQSPGIKKRPHYKWRRSLFLLIRKTN